MLTNFLAYKGSNTSNHHIKKRKQIAHSLLNCCCTTVAMNIWCQATCAQHATSGKLPICNEPIPTKASVRALAEQSKPDKKEQWCNTKVKIKSYATSGGKALTTGRWHTTNLLYCNQLIYIN